MKDGIVKRWSQKANISGPEATPTPNEDKSRCNVLRWINKQLINIFYNLGYHVGEHPLWYVIIPFVVSLILTTGVFFIRYEENPFTLFVPYTAPFLAEQKVVEEHFPMNYTYRYSPSRFTRQEGHARLLVTAKDGGSIFRPELWPDILDVDEQVRSMTVLDEIGEPLNYTDICSSWNGNCHHNGALNIYEIVDEVANGSLLVNYPVMGFPFIIPQMMGGVTINKTGGYVADAKAIVLVYFVQADTPEKEKL